MVCHPLQRVGFRLHVAIGIVGVGDLQVVVDMDFPQLAQRVVVMGSGLAVVGATSAVSWAMAGESVSRAIERKVWIGVFTSGSDWEHLDVGQEMRSDFVATGGFVPVSV